MKDPYHTLCIKFQFLEKLARAILTVSSESRLRENIHALGLTPIEANMNICSCKRHHQSKYWEKGAVDHETQ